jgi:murein DD-endopeptidase MepM/ murein hydrolase activator NlpD
MYFHASKTIVNKGDKVKEGQPVIVEGKTGGATGEHLHFVIKKNGTKINPRGINVGKYNKLKDTPYFKNEKSNNSK